MEDCLAALKEAAAALSPGAMLCTAGFSYDGAMSSMELMDPKMDFGMCRSHVASVAERVASGGLRPDFTPAGLVAMFDKLMQLEASFRDGNSLPQSLFVCLWVHVDALASLRRRLSLPSFRRCVKDQLLEPVWPALEADAVEDDAPPAPPGDVLRPGSVAHTLALVVLAYCTAAVKVADLERRVVHKGSVSEEEDMYFRAHNLDLSFMVSPQEALQLLVDAEAALLASHPSPTPVEAPPPAAGAGGTAGAGSSSKSRRKKKKKTSKVQRAFGVTVSATPLPHTTKAFPDGGVLQPAGATVDAWEPLPPAEADALLARLRFKRAYYVAMLEMDVPQGAAYAEAGRSLAVLPPLVEAIVASATEDADARRLEESMPMEPAARAAAEAYAKMHPPKSALSEYAGFDAGVVTLSVASNMPRFAVVPSYDRVWVQLRKLVAELQHVASVITAVAPPPPGEATGTMPDALFPRTTQGGVEPSGAVLLNLSLGRLFDFLRSFTLRQPSTVAVSRLWVSLTDEHKVLGSYSSLEMFKDELLSLGVPPPLLNNADMPATKFHEVCKGTIHNMLRSTLLNASRRRRDCKALLLDCEVLQSEAQAADVDTMQREGLTPQQWAHRMFHWVVRHSCRLLVDWLEIGVRDGLYVSLFQRWPVYWHLAHVLQYWTRAETYLLMGKSFSARAIKMHKKKSQKKKLPPVATYVPRPPHLQSLDVYTLVAQSYVFLLRTLQRLGLISGAVDSGEDPAVHYAHRFKALQYVKWPPPQTYEDLQAKMAETDVEAPELLTAASKCLDNAKALVSALLKHEHLDLLFPAELDRLRAVAKVIVTNKLFVFKLTSRLPGSDIGSVVSSDRLDTVFPVFELM